MIVGLTGLIMAGCAHVRRSVNEAAMLVDCAVVWTLS
jgi:hypothetical protein